MNLVSIDEYVTVGAGGEIASRGIQKALEEQLDLGRVGRPGVRGSASPDAVVVEGGRVTRGGAIDTDAPSASPRVRRAAGERAGRGVYGQPADRGLPPPPGRQPGEVPAVGQPRGAATALVLTDLKLPGADGIAVLEAAVASDPALPVLLLTGYGTVETAVSAMKKGAADFLAKPVDPDLLLMMVARHVEARRASVAHALLAEEAGLAGVPRIEGASPLLAEALEKLRRARPPHPRGLRRRPRPRRRRPRHPAAPPGKAPGVSSWGEA